MIDQHGAFLHAGEDTGFTKHNAAQVVIITDAGHHVIRTMCRFCRCRMRGSRIFLCPLGRFCRGPVIDPHRVPLGGKVSCHRVAHHAQADECGRCLVTHIRFPVSEFQVSDRQYTASADYLKVAIASWIGFCSTSHASASVASRIPPSPGFPAR